jgi:hypothetical protein
VPSVSKKQHNFMAMVANNPKMAKKVGIKPSVGKEFLNADKGKKFREGGMAKSTMDVIGPDLQKAFDEHEAKKEAKSKADREAREEGGKAAVKGMSEGRMDQQGNAYKKGGKVEKEAKSEERMEEAKDKKQDIAMIKKAFKEHDAQEHKGGKGTKITLKKGGSVRGCGCAIKGKTKGKIV